MARPRRHAPLRVYQNARSVGVLLKESSGAISFEYDASWLQRERNFPVSLSLPLQEAPYRGAVVSAVFDNLLPDSANLRRMVADKVGAEGVDAYSLLSKIGHDCVGSLQFVSDGAELPVVTEHISGERLDELAIERLLKSLKQAPLGLSRDEDFRISVAGAQEKTALLLYDGHWLKPHGLTPTTHIFKTRIGPVGNGLDLSDSVENEFYCLQLLEQLGLPVNRAQIMSFGGTTALVVERFDRRWHRGRLIRLPQEDCCQALSVPPTRKYQAEGGPSLVDLANLLKGSDSPANDHLTLFSAQLVFWLVGATDGHAKNFSLFLKPGGGYALTPLYDVLSAQPYLDRQQLQRKQYKLAMSVGERNHYRIHEVMPRHFIQTAKRSGVPDIVIRSAMESVAGRMELALDHLAACLPAGFPMELHDSIGAGIKLRLRRLIDFLGG
ncbi:type II toxin-antitoxin system HipA family toxin [Frateuria aurantia]|uniref:HipA domain-containing protein n=1 Tax=Frateuria aurantia (strain ATCC 33424 / DSM 6220 / KCTC 2777 / LMG 1558 / NBRC 3245 / NCIMB 13370) TaxID=767434 RepID=H8L2W1_FRAAD|nr:type II toxin-antitoxin system HipA family toxin [Frateuria aurantia]AFC87317.1 HipA domain-containing protein [Frateuria aurantia DSM 6220]